MTSSPGRVSMRSATWLAIVPWAATGRLLAEHLGKARLQLVGGRVLAVLVVADLRCRHRGAHGLGGSGDGIGPKVDHTADRLFWVAVWAITCRMAAMTVSGRWVWM